MRRVCAKCGFPLVGKKGHGFPTGAGRVCGECPTPRPKVASR